MQRLDIGLGFGTGLAYTKWTLAFGDLTTAGTTQTISLLENPPSPGAVTITPSVAFQIPQAGALMGVKIKHSAAFVAPSLTAMTVSVGCANSGPAFFASAFDVFQAVGDTVLQETALFKSGQLSANTVTVKFTSTGANVNTCTAGSVDIYLVYLDVSTSNIGTSLGVTSVAVLPGASGAGIGV